MRKLPFFLFLCTILISCYNKKPVQDRLVEIYLLTSYKMVDGKCQVNNNSIVLQDTPFVTNNEILKYSPSSHELTLSKNSQQKFDSLSPRRAIAVTLNKEVIYTAFNMPQYVNSSCDDAIVIMFDYFTRRIRINLGYPGINQNPGIDDQRNNAKLLSAFAKQGKLQ